MFMSFSTVFVLLAVLSTDPLFCLKMFMNHSGFTRKKLCFLSRSQHDFIENNSMNWHPHSVQYRVSSELWLFSSFVVHSPKHNHISYRFVWPFFLLIREVIFTFTYLCWLWCVCMTVKCKFCKWFLLIFIMCVFYYFFFLIYCLFNLNFCPLRNCLIQLFRTQYFPSTMGKTGGKLIFPFIGI